MKKYDVFASYSFTKILGTIKAESYEEAMKIAKEMAKDTVALCNECCQDFTDDTGTLDGSSIIVEEL